MFILDPVINPQPLQPVILECMSSVDLLLINKSFLSVKLANHLSDTSDLRFESFVVQYHRWYSTYLLSVHWIINPVFSIGVTTRRLSCCSSCCGLSRVASYATWPSWRITWRRRSQGSTPLPRNGPCSSASLSSTTHTSTMSSKLRYEHGRAESSYDYMPQGAEIPSTFFYNFQIVFCNWCSS